MNAMLARLGYAVADSLGDTTLVLAGTWVALAALAGAPPRIRYWIACGGMLGSAAPLLRRLTETGPAGGAGVGGGPEWPAWVAAFWMTGVLGLSLHTLGGWLLLWSRIRKAAPLALPQWEELCRRMRVRAELRVAAQAESPFAAGLWRPVVVIPAAALAGLPAEQLEAILLHELAHTRRYDYAMGLVLRGVEMLLFHHPGVWWLAGVIQLEREKACDDCAIAAGAGRTAFASALVALEEFRTPVAAPAATASSLTARIERILRHKESRMQFPTVFAVVAVVSLVLAAQPAGPYKMWLEQDVAYIIEPAEKAAFERLKTTEEMERFIVQFWQRRDPSPGTGENENKEEHYRRIRWANERYGWRTEQGRTYIVHGPPDEIEAHPAQKYEKWFYKDLRGVGKNVSFEFGQRPRAQVRPPGEARRAMEITAEQLAKLEASRMEFEAALAEQQKQVEGFERERVQRDIQRMLENAEQAKRNFPQWNALERNRLEADMRRLEAELANHQNQLKSFEQNRQEQEAFRLKQETEILQRQEQQKP